MLATAILTISLANQAQLSTTVFKPADTKVLLLPSVNISGDKHIALREEQIKESDSTLLRNFSTRGFQVIAGDAAAQITKSSEVDFTDEENYRKEVFYKIGEQAGVDIIVFNVITRTMQKKRNDIFENLEGFATMRTWVLDVKAKKPFLRGDSYDGTSAKNMSVGFGRQVRAVRLGLDQSLREFFKPYPVISK